MHLHDINVGIIVLAVVAFAVIVTIVAARSGIACTVQRKSITL